MIVISGASSGIGKATAFACAQAFNEPLLLLARRKNLLDDLKRQLQEQYSIDVHVFEVDLSKRPAIEQLLAREAALFEKTRVLINNAGLALGFEKFEQINLDDMDQMIDTNIKGLISLTRMLLANLKAQENPHVVNLGSVAGHYTYPNGNVYCATKFAVKALSETLRWDLMGSKVRVTEISPGMVETEFSQVRFKGDTSKAKAVYQGLQALKPEDIAEAIVWSLNRPAHVNIQEMVIYPTAQVHPTAAFRA